MKFYDRHDAAVVAVAAACARARCFKVMQIKFESGQVQCYYYYKSKREANKEVPERAGGKASALLARFGTVWRLTCRAVLFEKKFPLATHFSSPLRICESQSQSESGWITKFAAAD